MWSLISLCFLPLFFPPSFDFKKSGKRSAYFRARASNGAAGLAKYGRRAAPKHTDLGATMYRFGKTLFILAAYIALLPSSTGLAQQANTPNAEPAPAADDIAGFFSKVGDQIYQEDCIFELSDEQIEVQLALVEAYMRQGATGAAARRFAANQIQLPELSSKCKQLKGQPKPAPAIPAWKTPEIIRPPAVKAAPPAAPEATAPAPSLADKKILPQWDCAPGVDYVTIKRNGYERKLTGGEICNPFDDVVHAVPASLGAFRLGYTIRTGRLFVIAGGHETNGKTIAWAISGREVCRNNPDPDCLGARAVGPLPPGEYSFASGADKRVSWGPKTKRLVAGIYLRKLWHRERFSPRQAAAILARGNIAIHARLKGEMSEACLGLEPKGWAYVSSLIQDGRATGVNVYIDEPYSAMAENPPVITASSFSLSSLFN